jgi:signal transduction histidine kinase
MRLVPKYTLLLGTTLAIVLAILAVFRFRYLRAELESDMRRDHQLVGHVLQVGLADIWADSHSRARATRETTVMLARASNEGRTRFDFEPGPALEETQRVEGNALVSRFPVTSGVRVFGTLVAVESLDVVTESLRTHAWFNVAGIATIVVVGLLAALVMGRWLVGVPIALLIEQARRFGRSELDNPLELDRRDELGELSRELRAASNTLATSIEQLRHSDRLSTVGKLAAGVAHELGTPLSIVGGHAQMIAGREVTGDAALTSARAIDAEVTRMGKIVRQLLDFARRKGPEGTSCTPATVADRCVALLAPMAERAGVHCSVAGDRDARAMIDEDSLQQVLTNLLLNAIQAMPSGGSATVELARREGRVRIDVRDTGVGIPADARGHVFEPFFTTKQPGDGTGLGLSVVHGIVVDHHGTITIDSSSRGTTFSIALQEATA